MKNMLKALGLVALVAIIGLSMAACGDDSRGPGYYGPGGGSGSSGSGGGGGSGGGSANLIGTWLEESWGMNRYVFTTNSYSYYYYGDELWEEGTYTVSGSTIRLTPDEVLFVSGPHEMEIINSNTIVTVGGALRLTFHKVR